MDTKRRIGSTGIGLALAVALAFGASGCSSAGTAGPGGETTQTAGAPGAPPDGGGGSGSSAQYTPTGVYTLDSGSATKSGTINATENDQSGVLVTGGTLTLTDAVITTSGDSSSADESSFYGLNAGVLVTGGTLTMSGGSVKTTGSGANGIFAYGESSKITVSDTSIDCTGEYAHGIMTSGGGTIVANNLTVNTIGGSSAPVATDRGGGTITVNGGTYTCSGNNSPGLYSTGVLTANNATFSSSGSEIVVIEGSNSVTLNDCTLSTSKAGKWGVMIYQSMSGDAEGAEGTYTQTGGSLTDSASDSPLFYVTNSTGTINLKGVTIKAASGTLVKAAAGSWGTESSNGGAAIITADSQALIGDLIADKISSINLTLKSGSSLKGAIDNANTAKSVSVALDSTSTWTLTADSHVTAITGATISGSAITNITGNGHKLTYDKGASANSYLGGKTYTLAGGGTLSPE
ncbi:MAG: hypothetical protein AB2L09_03905 [Coriobacteriia bacterium]